MLEYFLYFAIVVLVGIVCSLSFALVQANGDKEKAQARSYDAETIVRLVALRSDQLPDGHYVLMEILGRFGESTVAKYAVNFQEKWVKEVIVICSGDEPLREFKRGQKDQVERFPWLEKRLSDKFNDN